MTGHFAWANVSDNLEDFLDRKMEYLNQFIQALIRSLGVMRCYKDDTVYFLLECRAPLRIECTVRAGTLISKRFSICEHSRSKSIVFDVVRYTELDALACLITQVPLTHFFQAL